MKKASLLLATCLSLHAFAQTDSTETTRHSVTYTSINTLIRTDIQRLPANSFMELVQGAFPFIGSTSLVEEDYTFLVDGFIAVNPNAINLVQIERIQFYPSGTTATRGSLGKKGTFVIEMQPLTSGFEFSTKNGLLLAQNNNSPTATTAYEYKKGFTTLNELSFRHKTDRAYLSSAISFLGINNPETQGANSVNKFTYNAEESRIRLSNMAGLQLNNNWQLDVGLFLTKQPKQEDQYSYYPHDASYVQHNSNRGTLYTSAHTGLSYAPNAKISNRLTAEISYAEEKYNQSAYGRISVDYSRTATEEKFRRHYAFSNHFTWKPLASTAIELEASLLARYRFIKGSDEKLNSTMFDGVVSQYEESYFNFSGHSLSLSPNVVLNLHQLLTAELGVTLDGYGYSSIGDNTPRKLLPNAGLRVELASLLPHSSISTLELSTNYQKYQSSYNRADLLGTRYRSNIPVTGPAGGTVLLQQTDPDYNPSKVWVSSLAVGWANNRMLLKASYRIYEEMIQTFGYLPAWPNSYYVSQYEKLKAENWSLEFKTVLLEKSAVNWQLTAMVFHDKYSRKEQNNNQPVTTPAQALYLDAGKPPLRSGLRSALTIRRFYLQAAALANWNEAIFKKDESFSNDGTTYYSNFLLAGYTWPVQSKLLKQIDANIQSKNLLHSNSYFITRYVGLGLHVRF